MFKRIAITAAMLFGASASYASTVCDAEVIRARLPGVDPSSVASTPLDGVCEIAIGPQIVYVSPDANYLLRGDIIEIVSNVNLTDKRRASARARVLDGIDKKEMIVFAPEEVKHTITVFTDIDCGYCRKLHQEMTALNDNGIAVQYLFFPRSGPNTRSWEKAQEVWCSDDRNDALTRAKRGEDLDTAACEKAPVMDQYQMGQMVGLRGTPAIVTESGELISGYLPAEALLARLESLKPQTVAAE
ncbi:MAG: DsbC family protein [Gammaproteobacteria bacterium]|nr:DsbC family protein [Gammaproteobacteria bacterium]NNF61632.1 DsbC family protein [Gammaproteobacteria bacterium]NNM20562.1 DsbC family protein [Gammaproteobacteria bacterium]